MRVHFFALCSPKSGIDLGSGRGGGRVRYVEGAGNRKQLSAQLPITAGRRGGDGGPAAQPGGPAVPLAPHQAGTPKFDSRSVSRD